jgi:hypothetical protein
MVTVKLSTLVRRALLCRAGGALRASADGFSPNLASLYCTRVEALEQGLDVAVHWAEAAKLIGSLIDRVEHGPPDER